MLKRVSFSVAVVALMWALAPSAEAAFITGDMSISGGLIPVNGVTGTQTSLASATGLDFLALNGSVPTPGVAGDFVVNSSDGNFTGLQGSTGLIRDFSFGGAGSANFPVVPVGSFELLGAGFSFDLSTISTLLQSANILNLIGTGVFHLTGFQNTAGSFIFSANQSGNTFSFSASQGATQTPIPEPGSMLLLGTGLIGLAGVARRRWLANA